QRHHAHPDEIRAMDALETEREHGAHTEEGHALCRPIARGSHAVALSGDDHYGCVLRRIAFRRAPQGELIARARMDRRARGDAATEQVANAPVGEKPAQHHFPIATARREYVEVAP